MYAKKEAWRVPKRVEVFVEFLVFGVVVGVTEDLIAVKLVTGGPITWDIIGVVVLVAIPFAVVGELIVDRVNLLPVRKKSVSLVRRLRQR